MSQIDFELFGVSRPTATPFRGKKTFTLPSALAPLNHIPALDSRKTPLVPHIVTHANETKQSTSLALTLIRQKRRSQLQVLQDEYRTLWYWQNTIMLPAEWGSARTVDQDGKVRKRSRRLEKSARRTRSMITS